VKVKEQEIKDVYHKWRDAVIVNDLPFLEQLFTEDFESVRNVGKPKGKSDELLWLGIKNVQYLYWEDKNISVNTAGDHASVKCIQTLDVLVYELPAKIDREIMLTFVKEDKQWHLQKFKEIPVSFIRT